jgi:hypothetical protein
MTSEVRVFQEESMPAIGMCNGLVHSAAAALQDLQTSRQRASWPLKSQTLANTCASTSASSLSHLAAGVRPRLQCLDNSSVSSPGAAADYKQHVCSVTAFHCEVYMPLSCMGMISGELPA